jgi:hypothetical protein
MGSKTLPTIWDTYMKLVTKYQISAINSCWEKCDEKCAYMFSPLPAKAEGDYSFRFRPLQFMFEFCSGRMIFGWVMALELVFLYPRSPKGEGDSCWEKCDEKCAYMFNVYKNQLSRQTGSRNLMGPKTLPTIWDTYMKLVTKYQISAINSCWEKCDEKCAYMFVLYLVF